MRKILIAAAVLLTGASADAATYRVDGVTIHVPTHCASTSCVSVAAPGYGYYRAARRVKPRKERNEIKAVAVSTKKEEAVAAPAAAAIPAATAPVAADPTLAAKGPDKVPQAPASVAEPATK
jgi:hypothetical protein